MHVRCPHCHNRLELVDDAPLEEILCSSCGSSFNLVDRERWTTVAYDGNKRIAQFELIEQLGVGAFGSVWRARDTQLDREVALKIPRKDQLEPAEAERFIREARAAAQLRHPSIVQIHEVGRDRDRLYIVSDLVRGATLADWLTGQRLTPREAAELCITLAEALHHAHQQGVVHRDLKPSNIMLDMDGKPHILDFGLAKRDAGEITMTVEGRVLGTPAYMSPEQACGEGHNADARSDVYSLGVVLFQLLTGEIPFRGNQRMLLVQIQNEEAPSPRKLNAAVPRDLETITLKCLEKNPDSRYPTARALADDLQRFLNDQSVSARPVGSLQRGWRWCRRNPALASASLLAIVALLAAATFGTVLGISQSKAAAHLQSEQTRTLQALASAQDQRELADRRATEAQNERRRAEANLQKAREAVDQFLSRVGEKRLAQIPQMEQVRRELLEDALKFYQGFIEEHGDNQAVREETARAFYRLGMINHTLGRPEQAEQQYRRSVEMLAELSAKDPKNALLKSNLGTAQNNFGALLANLLRTEEAQQFYQDACDTVSALIAEFPKTKEYRQQLASTYNNLGNLLDDTDQHERATQAYDKALALQRELVVLEPKSQLYRRALALTEVNFGAMLHTLNQGARAEPLLRDAVFLTKALIAESPSSTDFRSLLPMAETNLGVLLGGSGRETEAEALYRSALAMRRQLSQDFPSIAEYQADIATTCQNLANLLKDTDRPKEAETVYRESIALLEPHVKGEQGLRLHGASLARTYSTLGTLLSKTGRGDQAEAAFRQAIKFREEMVRLLPHVPDYLDDLAHVLAQLGILLEASGRAAEAEAGFRRAVQIQEELVGKVPDVPAYKNGLANRYEDLAKFLRQSNRQEEAELYSSKSLELLAKLVAEYPKVVDFRANLATNYHNLGHRLAASRKAEAEAAYREALKLQEQLVAELPNKPSHRASLARTVHNLSFVLADTARQEEADQGWLRAYELLKALCSQHPEINEYQFNFSYSCSKCADRMTARDEHEEAERLYRLALELRHQLAARSPQIVEYRRMEAVSHYELGKFLRGRQRLPEALQSHRDALTLRESLAAEFPKNAAIGKDLASSCNGLAWLLCECADLQIRDPATAVKLAQRATQLLPGEHAPWNTLGAAQYRNGDLSTATETLEKAAGLEGSAYDYVFLAMASWKLERKDEARTWYDKAVEMMKAKKFDDPELSGLLSEAESLLGIGDRQKRLD